MVTMNVSLPEDLKAHVDERVRTGVFQTSSEYVRELIRRDRDVQRFRGLIEEGAASPVSGVADAAYFDGLRAAARDRAAG